MHDYYYFSNQNTEEVWIMRGCVAHNHEESSIKLSQRVRKNIVLLLNLGISVGTIREKYLSSDHFGGISGQVPSTKFLDVFERKYYVSPPNLKTSGEKMALRYMSYQQVRGYNLTFGSGRVRPATGKSKDQSYELNCQNENVNCNDMIVVIMSVKQKEMFSRSSGSIIITCRSDLLQGLNLFSFCILGKFLTSNLIFRFLNVSLLQTNLDLVCQFYFVCLQTITLPPPKSCLKSC